MRNIIAIPQVTLDGVMQSPGGPEEGSEERVHPGRLGHALLGRRPKPIGETIAGEFDMLFGRRTCEIFAAYWPNHRGPIAKAFNKATKYVVTRSLDQLDWATSLHIGGDVVDEVRRLKVSDGPALHLGQQRIDRRRTRRRISHLGLSVSEGKRLFESSVPPRGLTLVETRSTPKGVLINTYRSAGPVKTGSL